MPFSTIVCATLLALSDGAGRSRPIHHYVFFGMDRESLPSDTAFLRMPGAEGAQVGYSWRQLETRKGDYDFSLIREDLALLEAHGKKLWIQIQDVSFTPQRILVPRYLVDDSAYHGGADKQYRIPGDDSTAIHEGWMARRWDPAVQERMARLFAALGREFDGRIAGINLDETSAGFGTSGRLYPAGYTPERYRDAIIANMRALKRAFPRSVAMQFANFMPGEWRPTDDRGYLRAVYDSAMGMGVALGGPDLLPFRPGQLGSSYPLIRNAAGIVPTGIAVQDGNFKDRNPKTGRPVMLSDLLSFATEYLQVDYIFWGREEPYYSAQVLPLLRR